MVKSNTRLELTWIGKENRPKLEPRILVEDPEKSYHATQRVTDNDLFDNRLIFGDNLLALKALEQEFTGKIKCIYIDPPFNTGAAFEYYDDSLEHSTWLSLMKERLEILQILLAPDGVIFVHIDDKELAYLRIVMDEVFRRSNFLNMIVTKTSDPSGHKTVNPSPYSQTEYLMMYSKDRSQYRYDIQYISSEYDLGYNRYITNLGDEYTNWNIVSLAEAVADHLGYQSPDEARNAVGRLDFRSRMAEFALEHSDAVFQPTAISDAAGRDIVAIRDLSRERPATVFHVPRQGYEDIYVLNGRQIYFYSSKVKTIDGARTPAKPLTNLWVDIPWNGIASEGGVQFKNGKKPEKLIRRCLEMTTKPGDYVLDTFAGSGTTGAVAHKMGRRWVMVELRDHCHTHIIPRMKKIIDGEDQGGISKAVNWQGGGGFRYYRLGPSMIVNDQWGNPIINPEFNAAMLAEAMCKLEGFTFEPNADIYWQQGRSSETDFIYVTTQMMTSEMLMKLSEEVGPKQSLLICCGAFHCDTDQFENLTVKKIPKAVLRKCEWGHDDYSLEIQNLPKSPQTAVTADETGATEQPKRPTRKFGKGKDTGPTLFDMDAIKSTGGK